MWVGGCFLSVQGGLVFLKLSRRTVLSIYTKIFEQYLIRCLNFVIKASVDKKNKLQPLCVFITLCHLYLTYFISFKILSKRKKKRASTEVMGYEAFMP